MAHNFSIIIIMKIIDNCSEYLQTCVPLSHYLLSPIRSVINLVHILYHPFMFPGLFVVVSWIRNIFEWILFTKLISKLFFDQIYFPKPNFSPDVSPQFCCSPWYNPRQDGSLGHSLPGPGQHLQHCHNKHTKSWGWVKLDNNYLIFIISTDY